MKPGRLLYGAERDRAIDQHMIWLMTGALFERVINDDAPIARFARSPERRVRSGRRFEKDLKRIQDFKSAHPYVRKRKCG